MLQYDYIFRKVKIYKDPKPNLMAFKDKTSLNYDISKEELKKILRLFEIVRRHNESKMEFTRKDKIVILSETMRQETITFEETKELYNAAKDIITKAENKIKNRLQNK
jgi:hypothetical protein